MAIRSVVLKDFTAFRDSALELSPGINVFIGENSTGKTHAMKAVYSMVRGADGADVASELPRKFAAVFRPDEGTLGRLGHRRVGQRSAHVRLIDDEGGTLGLTIRTKSSKATIDVQGFSPPAAVFLPSREGLAMFEGFSASYKKRELAFDETYFDLAEALSVAALRGALPRALIETGVALEAALGGKVVLEGGRFYLRGDGGSKLEAPLLSEGLRKLGSVLRLLQNGELRATGLLLWDEPEANLNPSLTVMVANALAALARAKVQVVIATHDYLLLETLAVLSREKKPRHNTRFFCFERGTAASGVQVSHADELDALPANPIRAEFLAHYDRMRELD